MLEQKKGCVYFFKHIGLEPVKIGYSSHDNPLRRFNQFKTYAPFGAEIIGFIITDEAKKIESELHQKFANKRLDGEWFSLTIIECEKIIEFYTSKEEVKERNDFQITFCKYLEDKRKKEEEINNQLKPVVENKKQFIINKYNENNLVNRTHLAKEVGVSRRYVIEVINNHKLN